MLSLSKHGGGVSKDGSVLAIEADAVQLHPVVDQAIAELLGDLPLQGLELGVDELDHPPALDIDEVVVVRLGRGLVA